MEKSKKKKSLTGRLFKGLMWLILILIALVIAVYLSLGFIVKKAVTTAVPPITGTSASVDDVDLSLLKGHIAIKGFKIGNPAGFASPTIFELGSIVVDFEPKSILSNKIMIKQILIDNTGVAAEINQKGQINLMVLQKNIENYMGPSTSKSSPSSAQSTAQKSDNGKKVVIKKLNIDHSKLTLGALGKTMTLNLPNIHQTGIGEGGKKQYTIKDTVALILSYFSENSIKAVMNSGNELFKQSLADTKAMLNNSKEAVTKQLDQAKTMGKNLGDNVKNMGSSMTDSVKGLGGMFKK